MTVVELPAPPVRILHWEGEARDADRVAASLRSDGLVCEIERVGSGDAFRATLAARRFDLILADHQPESEAALETAHLAAPDVPFIFVSGLAGEDVAVEALKRGATDYVVKQHLERLPGAVRRALAEVAARDERRQAEAALRTTEENFATLVNAMPQLCWIAGPDGAVTWYNRRWYEFTGMTPDEATGWGWQSRHDPALLPAVRKAWQEATVSGQPFEMTFPLRAADGHYRMFLTRAEPIRDATGAVARWLGTSTDISRQVEAEEALRSLNETLERRIVDTIAEREAMLARLHEAQKLETIGQLTGGVAHDFNNLLTPIVGSLDLLRRRIGTDERTQRLITAAMQGAERARTLVQRLLAFARRQVLEPRAVDVAALVDDMRELVLRSLGAGVRLDVALADDLPPARVDPGQLELAILNLAVNARDAMPEGGALTITVDRQSAGAGHTNGLRHGDYVRLAVEDTGAGMDEATLRRVVEPFFSTKGIGKGTGLGLSMVHGLAAQSGGGLFLHSRPGAGTRAEIWLPIANEPPPQQPGLDGAAPQADRRCRILLVDDEPLVRMATADMLADLGHAVTEAGSGGAALEALRSGPPPDLVITDYLMPGMTGAQLAAEIRAMLPGQPILIATGYAGLAGNAMADLPLLPKPFRRAELAATIDRLVRERPAAGRS